MNGAPSAEPMPAAGRERERTVAVQQVGTALANDADKSSAQCPNWSAPVVVDANVTVPGCALDRGRIVDIIPPSTWCVRSR